MHILWFVLLILLPVAALTYLGWHLWILLPFSSCWKVAIIILGILCFLSIFLNFTGFLDRLPLPLARVLYNVGTSSLIVILYMVLLFAVVDVCMLFHIVPRAWFHANWLSCLAVFGLLFGLLLYGNIRYNNKVRVVLDLPTAKTIQRDYKIVMASDLHLGYHNTRRDLARWVDMINAEAPDLILIAGDIVNMSVRPLFEEDMAAEFRRLQAPVYACLGNHEYYGDLKRALKFLDDAGITLLVDSIASVDSSLVVVGRDDHGNRGRKSLDELLRGVEDSTYVIVLDHKPYDLDQTERSGVDFQLSGHTHRGQVWPLSWVTDRLYECSWGNHQRGSTRYYVSSGLGIWGGKFRIGTQSEYVVAELKSSFDQSRSSTSGK